MKYIKLNIIIRYICEARVENETIFISSKALALLLANGRSN